MSEDRENYGDMSVDDEDQLQPGDTLDDPDVEDVLDRGYSPPDRPPKGYEDYPTEAERLQGESLDEKLAEEEPDIDPYAEEEATALIRAQQAHLALIPSVWPETWCFALSRAWDAGLPAAAFDLGAPAERIRRTGRGWVLPLALPPPALNDALLRLPLSPTPAIMAHTPVPQLVPVPF